MLFVFTVETMLLKQSLQRWCSFESPELRSFIHLNPASVCGDRHDEFSAIGHPNQQFASVGKTQREGLRELSFWSNQDSVCVTICRTTQVCLVVAFGRCTESYCLFV